jgi:putative membrane protein
MNMRIILDWVISSLAIIVSAYLLPGVSVEGFFVAFIFAIVLGFINSFVRPLLILLTLPLTIVTLGISIFFLNVFLIWGASAIVPGITIQSFWWAAIFSIVLSVVNAVLRKVQVSDRNGHVDRGAYTAKKIDIDEEK